MSEYPVLGIEHIWSGLDHLMFVFGLLLLVGGGARLLWTLTAFTVGHSITLALVTFGFLDYPVSLIEFVIALSIFVLALELTRANPNDRNDPSKFHIDKKLARATQPLPLVAGRWLWPPARHGLCRCTGRDWAAPKQRATCPAVL